MKKFSLTVAAVATLALTAVHQPTLNVASPPAWPPGSSVAPLSAARWPLRIITDPVRARLRYGPGYYPPRYYAPGPGYVADDYYGDGCVWQKQRFWDGYAWRIRRVRVCG